VFVASAPSHPAGDLIAAASGNRAHLTRLASAGRALRIARGVYAIGATLPPEAVAHHHRFALISHVWPGAVLSDRTALLGGLPEDGWMFIAHPDPGRITDLHARGLSISCRVGPGPLPGDMPMPCGLHLSGLARVLCENVGSAGRPAARRPARCAGTEAVEQRIDHMARTGGPGHIQTVLAQLDVIAPSLPALQIELVRRLLAAVLGTTARGSPTTASLRARIAGEPFDAHRVSMFRGLAESLARVAPAPRVALGPASRREWLPFFEAYFSNFIEGTEFGVEEARRIVMEGDIPASRPEDAHDVAATFRLASDPTAGTATARTSHEFIELLRDQHALLMAARPDKHPGVFKTKQNYAGGYTFVAHELVHGTLRRGFDCLAGLTDPFQRAVALMFLIAECHPFDDGNGRLARLVANATLSNAGQMRIVIAPVYRGNYLAGMTGMSANGRAEALHAVLDFAQRWTAAMDWGDFAHADAELHAVHAYLDPAAAEAGGVRLRLPSR
jgi:hypothetical protein